MVQRTDSAPYPVSRSPVLQSSRFREELRRLYPGAMPETVFVGRVYEHLFSLGFDEVNTIACVSVCRDEIAQPLSAKIASAWGEAFNFSSLAGMLFLGRTGFRASLHHAPAVGGRRRYCFFVLPHIAISKDGVVGRCFRPGQDAPSTACGALCALKAELDAGVVSFELDPDDVEKSLLGQKLAARLPPSHVPDLPALTRIALDVMVEDLEHLVRLELDAASSDYAVLSGTQVHGPGGSDFVAPGVCYAVVNGTRHDLTVFGGCPQ